MKILFSHATLLRTLKLLTLNEWLHRMTRKVKNEHLFSQMGRCCQPSWLRVWRVATGPEMVKLRWKPKVPMTPQCQTGGSRGGGGSPQKLTQGPTRPPLEPICRIVWIARQFTFVNNLLSHVTCSFACNVLMLDIVRKLFANKRRDITATVSATIMSCTTK